MAIAMLAETLEHLQHSTRLIPETEVMAYTLYSIRKYKVDNSVDRLIDA
jgi:hypothetical protein